MNKYLQFQLRDENYPTLNKIFMDATDAAGNLVVGPVRSKSYPTYADEAL